MLHLIGYINDIVDSRSLACPCVVFCEKRGNKMKKIALATAFAVAASAAVAGNPIEPMMEAPVIEAVTETASSSGSNLILPGIALLLIAAAMN